VYKNTTYCHIIWVFFFFFSYLIKNVLYNMCQTIMHLTELVKKPLSLATSVYA